MRDKKQRVYHYEKKNRAAVGAMLYAIVGVYIGYLGSQTTPLAGEPDGLSAAVDKVIELAGLK